MLPRQQTRVSMKNANMCCYGISGCHKTCGLSLVNFFIVVVGSTARFESVLKLIFVDLFFLRHFPTTDGKDKFDVERSHAN